MSIILHLFFYALGNNYKVEGMELVRDNAS